MKKTMLLCLAFLCFTCQRIEAQVILGISPSGIYNNNTYFGNIEFFSYSLANLSIQDTLKGVILVDVAVDSSGNGNLDYLVYDSLNLTIPPNTFYTDSLLVPITPQFRQGINTVVIWPKNDPQAVNRFIVKDSLEVNINILGYSAINEVPTYNREEVLLFPNPVHDIMYFKTRNAETSIERVRVWDMYGQLLKDESFLGWINMKEMAQGTYLVEFINKERIIKRYKAVKE